MWEYYYLYIYIYIYILRQNNGIERIMITKQGNEI